MDMICYCGHDCSRCRVYLATITGDPALREESVRFYKTECNLDIPPEKMRCLGGRSSEIMEACKGCPFMKCCKERNLHACADCPEYPCETIAWYTEKYVNKCNQVTQEAQPC